MNLPLGILTRALVIASMLLAVAAGLRPLAAQPAVLVSLTLVFLGAAVGARLRFGITASVILLFAYVAYGVVRLIGGPALAGHALLAGRVRRPGDGRRAVGAGGRLATAGACRSPGGPPRWPSRGRSWPRVS